ncbi:MAG: hypothetical protein CSA20_08060 [Deltaproteobacteria bacterium]|nr:MAG: hypothetical protein CSA20_08060 [Deltaproteobacteria bacterium]
MIIHVNHRKRKPLKPFLCRGSCAFLLCLMLLTQGCFPIFIAAVGAGGYLSANEEARENFKGFLTGIDQSLKTTTSRIASEEKTREKNGYRDVKGVALEIESFTVSPEKVRPGGKILVTVQYSLLGAGEEGVLIKDAKTLWYDKRSVTTLGDESVKRKNGTWESSLSFVVPDSAQKGKYKIKQVIFQGNNQIQSVGFFTITK